MAKKQRYDEGQLETIASHEIAAAQTYNDTQLSNDRTKAVEYMDGVMTEFGAEKGRSSVVDMTLNTTMAWMLPGIIRIFSASDQMAVAEPVEPNDEQWSKQATDGINFAFWKDNDGYTILHDGTYNSLLHGNGQIKHWWDTTPVEKVSFHTGLTQDDLAALLHPEDIATDDDGKPCEEIEIISIELNQYTLEPGDEGYQEPAGQQPDMAGGGIPPMPALGGMPAQGPAGLGDAVEAAGGMTDLPGGFEVAPGAPQPAAAPIQPQPMPPIVPPEIEGALDKDQLMRLQEGLAQGQAFLYDVKIKRTSRYGKVAIMAIAPEDFLISSESVEVGGQKKSRMEGHKQQKTRSELIEMGFDYDKVMGLTPSSPDDATNVARQTSGVVMGDKAEQPENEEVTLFELYMQLDQDMDGIAETIQMHYVGEASGKGRLLEWALWEDEPVFSDIQSYRVPHRWKADGLYKKVRDIQEINTVLTRQGLDNIYATNNPTRVVKGTCWNPDALSNPGFGQSIMGDVDFDVQNLSVEFMGDVAFKGIEYFNGVLEKRTGVSRTSQALDPEAIQGQTATAAQLAHDSAYTQVEFVARNHAEFGWKKVFRNILRLMVRHQQRKRTVRLRGQWVDVDPRYWNADMDVTINTGLGTGSRDRDMAVLAQTKSDQVAMAQIFREAKMQDKALEMVPMIVTASRKSAEAAGIRNVEMFYPEVGPQDIQAAKQAIVQAEAAGNPELQMKQQELQMKQQSDAMALQQQQQADSMKATLQAGTERIKVQNQLTAQREQIAADLTAKREQMQIEAALKREQMQMEAQLKREQWQDEIALKREQMAQQAANDAAANANQKTASETPGVNIGGDVHFGGDVG